MKRLLVLVLLVLMLPTLPLSAAGQASEGQAGLLAAPAGDSLESGSRGSFLVEISNPARDGSDDFAYGGNQSTAIGISAELVSRDQRIEVLSGPQQAGSLAAGEARAAEFTVQVNQDAGVGVYPLDLALSYQRLSGVEVRGDPQFPEVYFQYHRASQTIPLEARVALGSRMEVEARGTVRPGEESEVELVVHNRGDQAAVDAAVSLEPGPPINLTDGPQELGTVEPGKSSSARFRMVADMEAPSGPRPVSCNLSYLSGRTLRQEDRAVVLEVERSGSWGKALGGALLLAVLALAAVWLRGRVEISGLWRRRPGRRKW